ncbi:helix-turn-helix transcriptional regulator [Ornithinibacillus contaminans]|uniref:helix-turn-helix transcriptional regulator n=1 Tax=Ornithinibacillus contaminans TaxID=694055 RepID=UPI00064D887C|nr:helix-turn-helix transcriptional regulator [Ornithinibacillus contaminans]
MKFGDWLREKRFEQEWTQNELSTRSGVPQTTISGWETHKIIEPSLKHLIRISDVFSVRLADLPLDEIFDSEGVEESATAYKQS